MLNKFPDLLNKFTVTELSRLSGLSKSYVSQVKAGKRPPSKKLLDVMGNTKKPRKITTQPDYCALFLRSREAQGCSPRTIDYYGDCLRAFRVKNDVLGASRTDIENYLASIPANRNGLATRHAAFRALRAFYKWLEVNYDIPYPLKGTRAPIQSKPILPSLSREQVKILIDDCNNIRDKAMIAFFTESGLRITELANIKPSDIEWKEHVVRVMGKGRKEAYAPFGLLTEEYLQQWLNLSQPTKDSTIWGLNRWGITTMLRRLSDETGLPCNAHTFRRTFACLLRKDGIDTMTIKELGRWESLEMVQRYTRSVTFMDALKHYKAPLG